MKTSSFNAILNLLSVLILLFITSNAFCQNEISLTGSVKDFESKKVIPFATISTYMAKDSSLVTGTITDENGGFIINDLPFGKYYMNVSFVGYETQTITFSGSSKEKIQTGNIFLKKTSLYIDEAKVVGKRMKAKTEGGKTVYYVNSSMNQVSNNGIDLLQHLPGVHIDFNQNLLVEGSEKILVLVNGSEKDPSFLRQLEASRIDKIEMQNNPGSKYDSNIQAVINIILKDEQKGISGQFQTDIPTSTSEMYLFPSMNINYGFKKMNLHAAYDSEFSYFDIEGKKVFEMEKENELQTIILTKNMRQKNWSHRFNVGFDYQINEKNQFNFYGSYNPYSWEHDGELKISQNTDKISGGYANLSREDNDQNYKTLYSINYSHLFNNRGAKINLDLNYYNLNSSNSKTLKYDSITGLTLVGKDYQSMSLQNSGLLRADLILPVGRSFLLESGFKGEINKMENGLTKEFHRYENNFSLYTSIKGKIQQIDFNTGIRVESSIANSKQKFFDLLPHFNLEFSPAKKHSINLSYRQSVIRPHLYQLYPNSSIEDPFTILEKNSQLQPATQESINLKHSITKGGNYLSTGLFYIKTRDAIKRIYNLNDPSLIESAYVNAGNISQYGLQSRGSFRFSNFISLSHYLKIFNLQTRVNRDFQNSSLKNINDWAYESVFSAIVSFPEGFNTSFNFQYYSDLPGFQSLRFSDPLYFISINKTFSKDFKIGIKTAIPFKKSFTYNGYEIKGENIKIYSEENIRTSGFPLWININYSFRSGKNVNNSRQKAIHMESAPKNGF